MIEHPAGKSPTDGAPRKSTAPVYIREDSYGSHAHNAAGSFYLL